MSETGSTAQYIADLEAKDQEWQDRCLVMQTERDALRQRVEELEQTQARMVKCGDDLHDALSAAEAENANLRGESGRLEQVLVERDALRQRVEELERSCAGWEADAKRETQNAQFHREWRMKAEAEALLNRQAAEKHYAYGERCLAIAKEAEDESQEAEERHKVECAELRQRLEASRGVGEAAEAEVERLKGDLVEAEQTEKADEERISYLEAEVERLRAVVEDGLELTRGWTDVAHHNWRNKAHAALAPEVKR